MVHIIRMEKNTARAMIAAVLMLALMCALCRSDADAASAPSVSAKSAIVTSNGCALYEKSANIRLPMASTTKLMAAILAIENCPLDEQIEIKSEYCNVEGSSMYLRPGERRTVRELVMGLLLVSGNDAAQALACHISGDCARFAALMNAKAQKLGMTNTHFTNPHGLSDNAHYSTARDLACLMEYCMANQTFAEIDRMPSATVEGKLLVNHNRLLHSCPGCIGGKTGFTEAAGRCLVSCCERDGVRAVCVTLAAPNDWDDHMALYNWAFSHCVRRSITSEISFAVPVVSGERRWVRLVPETDVSVLLPPEKEITLTAELPWFEFAPVAAGQRDGKVTAFVDGMRIAEYYLVYGEDVAVHTQK